MSYRSLTGASAGAAAALVALTLTAPPAWADSTMSTSCAGRWSGGSCVTVWRHGVGDPHIRVVPAPSSEAELAAVREREERWLSFCRPKIVQDHYGVEYYTYAAPGCQFGRYR